MQLNYAWEALSWLGEGGEYVWGIGRSRRSSATCPQADNLHVKKWTMFKYTREKKI
jgi:hypothetical protein